MCQISTHECANFATLTFFTHECGDDVLPDTRSRTGSLLGLASEIFWLHAVSWVEIWHIRGWKFGTFMGECLAHSWVEIFMCICGTFIGGNIHVYMWHIHWWKFSTLACTMNVPNLAHSWVEIWHMNLAQSWVEIARDKTSQSCVKEPNLNP